MIHFFVSSGKKALVSTSSTIFGITFSCTKGVALNRIKGFRAKGIEVNYMVRRKRYEK